MMKYVFPLAMLLLTVFHIYLGRKRGEFKQHNSAQLNLTVIQILILLTIYFLLY